MTSIYWLLYDRNTLTPEGPYADIHRCRENAVRDASDLACRVQIHRGELDFCEWDSETLVEEW